MKKTSTPILDRKVKSIGESCRAFAPKASTVAFLRQFARAYQPGSVPALPGYVLN